MSETKGVEVTGANFNDYISSIGVYAYLHGTVNAYISDETLTKQGTLPSGHTSVPHWIPADNHTYYWPKAQALDFWAWAPKTVGSAVTLTAPTITDPDKETATMTFSYNLAPGETPVPASAVDQPDLMFATQNNVSKSTVNTNGCVGLEFEHALAAVKFVISSEAGGKLKSIEIGNAAYSGNCVYKKGEGAHFTWTVLAYLTEKTFKQTFTDLTIRRTDTPVAINDAKGNNTAVFMMIPQTLEAGKQKVKITFDYDGTEVIYTGDLKQSISAWDAGKVYTYTLKLSDGSVDITVEDKVTETVKSNVQVKNSGGAPAFVRATIVANWVNGSGRIIAPLQAGQGTYVGLPTSTTAATNNWIVGADGFYYYTKPVLPGKLTGQGASDTNHDKLFDTYTISTSTVAPAGTHLEMYVVAQAICSTGYGDTEYVKAWQDAGAIAK